MSRDESGSTEEERSDHATGESGDDARSGISRRRLVATGAATWATVGLAGCDRIDDPEPKGAGGGGGGGGGSGDGGGGGGSTSTDSPAPTDDGTGTGNTTVSTTTTATDDPGDQTETPTTTTSCESIERFARGMDVGLHVGVYDSATGAFLGDDEVDSVVVEFPHADIDPVELDWSGPHEQYDDDRWGGKITTDEGIEPGRYEYEITVEGVETDGPETVTDRFTLL